MDVKSMNLNLNLDFKSSKWKEGRKEKVEIDDYEILNKEKYHKNIQDNPLIPNKCKASKYTGSEEKL